MKESTRIMLKKHGARLDRFFHNYIYFVFYYPYVKSFHLAFKVIANLTWFKPLTPVFKMIINRYHAKVISMGDTAKIFQLNEDVRIVSNENKQVIPFKYAHKIIFSEPEYIAVMDCPCKKSTNAASEDINSCIAVGKNLSLFWLEHCQKYNPRKITQKEALEIIERLRKKNHINQAFFKVATGGSTGVICNCHPDTCVSLQGSVLARKFEYRLSQSAEAGYSVTYDETRCTKCGVCENVCPFHAIRFNAKGIRIYHQEDCMGCELCVEKCPEKVLTLFIDPNKASPLDLDRIRNQSTARQ
jgi:NAD-dependent dihydropyrimidine dehydrogenase PreA subunit